MASRRILAQRELPEGQLLPYRGQQLSLHLTTSLKKPQVTLLTAENRLWVNFYQPHPLVPVQLPLLKWYRRRAEEYIPQRAAYWSQQTGFSFNKLFIKDQSSRWGSCSSLQNLNFNWRLIMAPEEVIDYVIIHELCHLRQMNHSKDFWALVARHDPECQLHRKWLRDHGRELFTILPQLPMALLNAVYFHV